VAAFALLGGGLSRIPHPGVRGQQVPGPGDLDPSLLDRLEARGAGGAGVGIGKMDEVAEKGEADAGLHLVGVVADALENLAQVVGPDLPPINQTNENGRLAVEFAQERLERVAAVGVEDDELADAVGLERADNLGDHRVEHRLADVDGQREAELVGVHPVGDGRQQDDLGAQAVCGLAAAVGHQVGVEGVGAIGDVEIVWLGGAHGKDGDLEVPLADHLEGQFIESPFSHRKVSFQQ